MLVGEKSTERPSSDGESDCSDSAVPWHRAGRLPVKKKKSVNPEHGKKNVVKISQSKKYTLSY